MAKELIWRFDLAEETRLLSPWEHSFRSELKKKLLGLCSFECTIARQQSHINWLQEGDANTHFFHLHANHCKRRNFIAKLKVDGSWIQSQAEIKEALHGHFANLISRLAYRPHTLDLDFLNVPSVDLMALEASFSEAIKSLAPGKALGPDGFTGIFYLRCWDFIKTDVMASFHCLGRLAGNSFDLLNQAITAP